MFRKVFASVAAVAVFLMTGCRELPAAPSPSPGPAPLPAPTNVFEGTWSGSMTDWFGTAQATLTLQTGGFNTLSYQYSGRPASYAWYDVLTGGHVTVVSAVVQTLTFTFVSPNIGTQGPYCWAGDFEGRVTADESGLEILNGSYKLRGWSEDCFSPPRKGSFSLVHRRQGGL